MHTKIFFKSTVKSIFVGFNKCRIEILIIIGKIHGNEGLINGIKELTGEDLRYLVIGQDRQNRTIRHFGQNVLEKTVILLQLLQCTWYIAVYHTSGIINNLQYAPDCQISFPSSS